MPHLVAQITQIEIDTEAQWIAKQFLDGPREQDRFCQVTQDANDYDFALNHQLIINCSTEHFDQDGWYKNVPKGRVLAIQSTNNTREPTHVNTMQRLSHFTAKYPLEITFYSGYIDVTDYRRYMRIGRV